MQRDKNCSISADLPRVDRKCNSRVLSSAWSRSMSMPVQYKRVSCRDLVNRSRSMLVAFSVNLSAMTLMELLARSGITFTDKGFSRCSVVPVSMDDSHKLKFARVKLTQDPTRGLSLNSWRILSSTGESWLGREMLSPDR